MPPRDEFDDPEGFSSRFLPLAASGGNRAVMISGAVFVGVLALSAIIWASYPDSSLDLPEGSVPVIRADASPYKEAPEDRGGMIVPHQDSTIFSAMRDGQPDGGVENLLADGAEEPVDRQELFAGLKNDVPADAAPGVQLAGVGGMAPDEGGRRLSEGERRALQARKNREALNQQASPLPGDVESDGNGNLPTVLNGEEIKPGAVKVTEPAPEMAAPSDEDLTPVPDSVPKAAPVAEDAAKAKVAEPVPAPAPEPAVAQKTPEPAVAQKTPEPAPEAAAPSVATGAGDSFVQVASVQDQGKVESEWHKLSSDLPMLKGLSYRVKTVDLPGKGVYHRIQVGPMAASDAKALCDRIKTKKPGGCLLAK